MSESAAGGESQNPNSAAGSGAAGAGDGTAAGGTGSGSEQAWVATLPEELRGSPSAKKFKGKTWDEAGPEIFKAYHHLERWQIPGEDATPEQKAAFHRRMGVPEKVEDYKITPEVPEGVPWNDEIQGAFAKFAHEQGLPPAVATRVVNWYLQRAGQGVDMQTTASAEEIKKTQAALRSKWGGAYDRNAGLVNRAVEEYGSEEFTTLLDNTVVDGVKLGNHPAMLEFLRHYGEQRLEAGFIPGDSLLTTQKDALAEANAILDDPKHPYWQGDKAAIAKVQKLLAIAHPDPKRP